MTASVQSNKAALRSLDFLPPVADRQHLPRRSWLHVGAYHDWIAVVFIDENQVELNAKVTDALKDHSQAGIMVDDVEVLSTGEYDTADTEHYLC